MALNEHIDESVASMRVYIERDTAVSPVKPVAGCALSLTLSPVYNCGTKRSLYPLSITADKVYVGRRCGCSDFSINIKLSSCAGDRTPAVSGSSVWRYF